MNHDISDHSRFMPRPQGEEAPKEEIVEETIIEEVVVVPPVSASEPMTAPSPNAAEAQQDEKEADSYGWLVEAVPLRVIYNIFNPLLAATYATLFIFLLSILSIVAQGATAAYSLTVFGATCVIPLIVIFVMQRLGLVGSMRMYKASERTIPYVVEFLALGAMSLFFLYKGAHPWIWTIYLGGAALALVNMVINFKLRVSNHCSAIASLLAVLIVIEGHGLPPHSLFWWVVGAAILIGIIGLASMTIGRHRLSEVLIGYATGFLSIILFTLLH